MKWSSINFIDYPLRLYYEDVLFKRNGIRAKLLTIFSVKFG